MIKFGIGIKKTGKGLTQLSRDLRVETTGIRNDVLEKIRQQLMREAPRRSKGNKYSQNRIYDYLSKPSNCVRKRGKFGGYIILETRKLPHLKYVPHGTKPHKIEGNPLLYFWWRKQKMWFCGYWVKHPGTKSNDFLTRAYIRSRKPIHYATKKRLLKVLYKR